MPVLDDFEHVGPAAEDVAALWTLAPGTTGFLTPEREPPGCDV
jgi:hypothetical protein